MISNILHIASLKIKKRKDENETLLHGNYVPWDDGGK